VPPRPIDPDEVCPICQDSLQSDEALTHCKVSCGNRLHVKCAYVSCALCDCKRRRSTTTHFACLWALYRYVWSQHKHSQGEAVTCPLCRSDWGRFALTELRVALEQSKLKQQSQQDKEDQKQGAAKPQPMLAVRVTCHKCRSTVPRHNALYRCAQCVVLISLPS
jgi:hypothetical protein